MGEFLMILIVIILFLITAGFAVVLFNILQDKPTPKPFVYTLGTIAALVLLTLIYFVYEHPDHAPITSLVLFLVAALGSFTMFFLDVKGKHIPKWLALIQPLIAIIGVLSL